MCYRRGGGGGIARVFDPGLGAKGGFGLFPGGGGDVALAVVLGVDEGELLPLVDVPSRCAAFAAFFFAKTAAKPPGSMPGRTATGVAPASAITPLGMSCRLGVFAEETGLGARGGVADPFDEATVSVFLARGGMEVDTLFVGAAGGARFVGAGVAGGLRFAKGMSSR